MSADPLDAAAQVVAIKLDGILPDDWESQATGAGLKMRARDDGTQIIDAWLRVVVAHEPCNGTGRLPPFVVGGETDAKCPGPHVKIGIGDVMGSFEILYADPLRAHDYYDEQGDRFKVLTVPLPATWMLNDQDDAI